MDSLSIVDAPDLGSDKPLPVDLSHHYSEVTKNRVPSKIKAVYKLFQIPGIGNLAGGLFPLFPACLPRPVCPD